MSDEHDNVSYRPEGLKRTAPLKSDPPRGERLGPDFIASIVICGIVGALVDRAFQTAPWGFLLMLALGIGVGIGNWLTMRRKRQKPATNTDVSRNKKK